MNNNENFEKSDKKDFITLSKEAIGFLPLEIKIKKLDERACIPYYAYDGDVGMDLTAIDVEYDEENDLYIYHTGLSFESDKHYGQFLFPRSSNRKTDAYLCNSVGIADSAIYRGEILICFKNRDSIKTIARLEAMNTLILSMNNGDSKEQSSIKSKSVYNEILERAKNLEFAPYKVGDRIAQMVFLPYPNIRLSVRQELSETERGANGFGSTGN